MSNLGVIRRFAEFMTDSKPWFDRKPRRKTESHFSWNRSVVPVLGLVTIGLFAQPVFAGDWTATKLRGLVFVNNVAIDNQWVPLKRGDIVSDSRVIRTLASGRVEFTKENETLDVGGKTQIRILDRAGNAHFTTIKQDYGKVTVEANVEQVKHFAVDTPFLVAAVKGTIFTVRSGPDGTSVEVIRGLVGVTNKRNGQSVNVPAGRQLHDSAAGKIRLTGHANGAALAGEDIPNGGDGGIVGVDSGANIGSGLGGALGDTVSGTVGTVTGVVNNTADTATETVHDTTTSSDVVGGVTGTLGGAVQHVGSLLHL